MTLDAIVERLQLPRTTIYSWIKDIPIPTTEQQTAAQRRRAQHNSDRAAAIREGYYQEGLAEAPRLFVIPTFETFVTFYLAEGYKRNRNQVAIGNSNAVMLQLSYHWIQQFTQNKFDFRLQCHVDRDEAELQQYWGGILDVEPEQIKTMRKSNSGQLSGRQFRSVYGVLTIRVGDTRLRSMLDAWMEYLQQTVKQFLREQQLDCAKK